MGFGKGVLWQSQGFDFRERGNYWNGKKEWFEFKAINDGLPAIVDELECWTGKALKSISSHSFILLTVPKKIDLCNSIF